MPKIHWHASVEDMLIYGVSAIIVINLWRFAAAKAAKADGFIGTAGRAAGGLVTWGGNSSAA